MGITTVKLVTILSECADVPLGNYTLTQ